MERRDEVEVRARQCLLRGCDVEPEIFHASGATNGRDPKAEVLGLKFTSQEAAYLGLVHRG